MLISPEKQALLTDFGVSRMDSLSAGYTTHSAKGSTRWQAYEFFDIFEDDSPAPQHTQKTDIWAFGMTVYVGDVWISIKACFADAVAVGTPDTQASVLLCFRKHSSHQLHLAREIAQGTAPFYQSWGRESRELPVVPLQWMLEQRSQSETFDGKHREDDWGFLAAQPKASCNHPSVTDDYCNI